MSAHPERVNLIKIASSRGHSIGISFAIHSIISNAVSTLDPEEKERNTRRVDDDLSRKSHVFADDWSKNFEDFEASIFYELWNII